MGLRRHSQPRRSGRRTTPLGMDPFGIGTEQGRPDWRRLLLAIEQRLVLSWSANGPRCWPMTCPITCSPAAPGSTARSSPDIARTPSTPPSTAMDAAGAHARCGADLSHQLPARLQDRATPARPEQWPDAAALIQLAGYLDAHDTPIDYQRRRQLDYRRLLPTSQWRRPCRQAQAPRQLDGYGHAAKCVLFEQLSDTPPTSRRSGPPPASPESAPRCHGGDRSGTDP